MGEFHEKSEKSEFWVNNFVLQAHIYLYNFFPDRRHVNDVPFLGEELCCSWGLGVKSFWKIYDFSENYTHDKSHSIFLLYWNLRDNSCTGNFCRITDHDLTIVTLSMLAHLFQTCWELLF